MSNIVKHLTPAYSTHPGEVLYDELEDREIRQKDFALSIGLQPTQLNEIIKGKRGINAELALLIGKALEMDPVYWNNLQSNFELDQAKIQSKTQKRLEALDKWSMIKQYLPEKFFRKIGVLNGDPISDIPTIQEVYQFSHFEQLASTFSRPIFTRFRKSEKLDSDKINLVGWVKFVEWQAGKKQVGNFNIASKDDLIDKLKTIIASNKNTVEKSDKILCDFGVKLIIQSHPEKCAVDGISFWSNNNPAIGLTLRHKRIDNFAFTLFHELGHVFMHISKNKEAQFIDVDEGDLKKRDKEEVEANEFAKDNLIDCKKWEKYFGESDRLLPEAVISFAQNQNVHPAIVKGRLCHELKNYKLNIHVDNRLA